MSDGYLFWADPWFDGATYLDGRLFSLVDGPESLTWSPGPEILARRTLAGTHVTQRRYLGDGAPFARSAYSFQAELLAAENEDARAVCRSPGRVVWFCPVVYCAESFNVTSGQSYKLSRPQAFDVVPGMTSGSHPTSFVLDGVATPGAATISGQTLTAAATGELVVHYCPVFRVMLTSAWSWSEVNALRFTLTADEVIEV